MDLEKFGIVDAIGVLGGIFVELLEEVHYFDERMIVGDVFCVAVCVVAFAIHMNCFEMLVAASRTWSLMKPSSFSS